MHEQDLKSLLENIYHLLAEDDWYNNPPPPPPKPVYGPSYDLPKPLVKNPEDMEDMELLYGPNWNDTRAPLNPPRNIKPEEYIDWVIRNIQQHNNTPFTQEEIERYFTDSVKLKNIHSTLIEEAPDGDGATITGAEKYTPSQAPGPRPTTFYDPYAQPPTLFPLGPWDGQWLPGFAALWPPPTSTLPPTGPGGMWVSYTNPGSTQVFYFYVYPGVDGMFPVWHWGEGTNGNFVFTELPPWGLPT